MFSRIVGEIPTWMHADDVAFRQELARYATPLTGQQRIWRVVRWVLLLSGLVLVGTGIASVGLTQRAGETITQAIWNSLYFPLLLMQAVASLNALVNIADTEQTTGVDDALKTTPLGIGLWLRARWLGGYLRMRPWLVFFVVGRLVMVGCLFIELIAMRGSYLDLIAQLKADPPISPVLAILLVALGVTASFVLPFTTLGL